ncbi:MAG: metallophosphoesterase [Kiritimatiellae bacterium]|nr:metallophosphoesterase [Kiritimatiellia bacterium]
MGKNDDMEISRRGFIGGVAALGAGGVSFAAMEVDAPKRVPSLIASAPVLQNAAERSMGVAFAVSADASGWVEISRSPDMGGARRVYSGGLGMMEVDDKLAQIRLRDLRPATRYWYRIGADRIEYKNGYRMKNLGSEVDGNIHSFTTLGAEASGSFCIINDTHDQKPALDLVLAKLAALKPSVVIWNGDALNKAEKMQKAIDVLITPHEKHPGYAADMPFMFLNGNHDFRGRFARHLERVWMFRDPAERGGRFAELGRNFVQRLGDVALIGLETGEDKPDDYPVFARIFQMDRYRDLQTEWLAEAVESPTVKTAKFKVAICHIPLFHPNWRDPKLPGGDGPVNGKCAAMTRPCAFRWRPLLEKAGIHLVVSGHTHRYVHYAPDVERAWSQIVGGGCAVHPGHETAFPSVVEGFVKGGSLVVRVHNCTDDKIVMERSFS